MTPAERRIHGQPVDRQALRRLTGRADQTIGVELSERLDGRARGVRVARVRTGEIDVEVVVDRALDLAQASVRGVPLAWISPTGLAGPWYAEPRGVGPLRTFFGGLLTTGGLDHVLGAEDDDVPEYRYPDRPREHFPLHGRLSATPARLTAYGVDWEADEPAAFVHGEVRQAAAFAEHLVLERRIRAPLGGRTLRLTDVVRNDGYAPTVQALLYHVNVGWPVLGPAARIVASVGEPVDATPAAAGRDWRAVLPPAADAVELVWEHAPRADADGRVRAAVVSDDAGGVAAGLAIAYRPEHLPHLLQWSMFGEGHYVVGLEPCSFDLGGRAAARGAGALPVLEPGEERRYELELQLLHGADDVRAAEALVGGRTEPPLRGSQ